MSIYEGSRWKSARTAPLPANRAASGRSGTRRRRVPGLFAAGELRGRCTARIVWVVISSATSCLGKIAGEHAGKFAKNKTAKALDSAPIEEKVREGGPEPFNREKGVNPFCGARGP